MNIQQLPTGMDLSLIALEIAANLLPATKIYQLQIHPEELTYTQTLLKEIAVVVKDNPFAPSFSLTLCPYGTRKTAWALWSGDSCVWSQGG